MVLDTQFDSNGVPYFEGNSTVVGFPFGPCAAVAYASTPAGFATVAGLPNPAPVTVSHRHGLYVPPAITVGALGAIPHCNQCALARHR